MNYLITKNFAACVNFDYSRYFDMKVDGDTVDDTAYNQISLSVGLKAFVTFDE